MIRIVALIALLGYSYTKRFTSLAHFVLGLALGIAPIGAWIAVRGSLEAIPLLLGLAVMLWTAGFDFIYACQDYEVDRREGLHSIPVALGISGALALSNLLHVLAVAALCAAGKREIHRYKQRAIRSCLYLWISRSPAWPAERPATAKRFVFSAALRALRARAWPFVP